MKLLKGFVLIFVIFFYSCSGKNSPAEPKELINKLENAEVVFTVFPNIGTVGTEFELTINSIKNESSTIKELDDYSLAIDTNNDGKAEYEGEYISDFKFDYKEIGLKEIKVTLKKDEDNFTSNIKNVHVPELIRFLPPTPDIFVRGELDWSKNGENKFIFIGKKSGYWHNVFLYSNKTKNIISLTKFEDQCAHYIDFSPSCDTVAFHYDGGLQILDISTKVQKKLVSLKEDIIMTKWSPSGKDILFCNRNENGELGLWNYNFDTDTSNIFINEEIKMFCWNLDGTKVVINKRFSPNEIEIIDFSTKSSIKKYTTPVINNEKCEWSPNNKYLSLGWCDDDECFYILSFESEKLYSFKTDLYRTFWPSWSDDGKYLAFEGNDESKNASNSIWGIEFPQDLE